MTDWHDPVWQDHRHLAEELDSSSPRADSLPQSALDGLAASQWIHALLRTRRELSAGTSARDNRIAEVMHRIARQRRRPVSGLLGRRTYLRLGSLAIAATLLLVLFLLNFQNAPDAVAQVRRLQDAMRDDTAREYAVEIELESLVARRAIEGTLTVRGAKEFLFECRLPLGGTLMLGADGTSGWGIAPVGPVAVSSDPERVQRWARRFPPQISPQILQIDTVLSRMATDYRLSHDSAPETNQLVIKGTKQPGAPSRFPDQIDLVADAESGIVKTLTMHWTRETVLPLPKQVTLQFRKAVDIDDAWFGHEQHHDPDRPVIELGDESATAGNSRDTRE